MLSDSFRYNTSTCSLRTFILRLAHLNDVSHSVSQIDPPPIAPPRVRGMVSPFVQMLVWFIMFTRGINIPIGHFLMTLRKMTNYKIYLSLLAKPTPWTHRPTTYKEKYKRSMISIPRFWILIMLNACLSSLNVTSGTSSVTMLSMFIGFLVSIPLGTISLARASVA